MKLPPWLLPIIATSLMAVVAGGYRFYVESQAFHATYEDEAIEQIEDNEERDNRLEWLRDRMNELRQEHGKPLLGWSKGE